MQRSHQNAGFVFAANQADSVPLSDWVATTSGEAVLALSTVAVGRAAAGGVPALRMRYDFKQAGGFVVARRAWARAMPEEFAIRFRLRGSGSVGDLELKLVDPGGLNVWRCVLKSVRRTARWRRVRIASRDLEFAWGPSSGSAMTQLGFIEVAVVAAASAGAGARTDAAHSEAAATGGAGELWLADLTIEDSSPRQAPRASASSAIAGFAADVALAQGWRPDPADHKPWLVIDCQAIRSLGGLVIDWLERAPAGGFRVSTSNTGRRWKTVHSAERAGGRRSSVYLPGCRTRMLRLQIHGLCAGARVDLRPFDFSRSIEAFWYAVVAAEPRGWHPRWLHREQSLWTPVGVADGMQCGLIDGDGRVEPGEGGFSLEPCLTVDGRLWTWADVTARQELEDGWLPVPSVIWETAKWRLRITAESTVAGHTRVRYRFENLAAAGLAVRLFVLIRPFQVTPPWQHFRNVGGVRAIHALAWRDGSVRVDETLLVTPASAPDGFGGLSFDEGFIAPLLAAGLPPRTSVHDPFGFATGALVFDLAARAGVADERVLSCAPAAAGPATFEAAFDWRGRLPVAQWSGNGWAGEAIRAALTATAQVLVTRCGPALQPGPRRYTRSWIRDGAMMSAALLRMGQADAVRDFIRWYARYQRADGFVPCCVDRDGVDPLVEHDSHGQWVALVADHYRFTADEALLRECWPSVEKALGYLESILGTDGPDGLLPISVSHEGYLAQPVHSYWDNFWAVRGLRDAVPLAELLGHAALAQRWRALAARLSAALFASIEATRRTRALDFTPGSIEWADFDPTATANAVYLLGVPPELDRAALERTFDLYLADWRRRRSGALPWSNYTPYEIRIIGALVRLGRRGDALELLRFFLADRRPEPWNQWPEIAWRDAAAPAHLGDLPHTWIAAEYVLSLRSVFAYEEEGGGRLILAAGLDPDWLEADGCRVERMPTAYGPLTYTCRRTGARTVQFTVRGGIAAPLVLRPPLAGVLRSVTLDGRPCASFDGDSVTLDATPADVVMTTDGT